MTRVTCPRCSHNNAPGRTHCEACQAPLPYAPVASAASAANGQAVPPSQPPLADAAFVQFQQGQVLANRYTVHNIIGRGGMGCIYKVHDNVLGEYVALKTLLPQYGQDKLVLERFFNEARIARRLAHPNIVRVHDIGKANEIVYISMECVEGKSLRAMLEQTPANSRLPLPLVLKWFDALCAALEYAHRYTIHRDLKPENVMVNQQNVVKLMDFGISKLMAEKHLTGASLVMGTPFYMSPEQMKNSRDVDARADIYSMGVMLYEMLTGRLPAGVAKPISQINRDIPPAFDQIVEHCVDQDPENRYQNATELRTAIRQVAQQTGYPLGPISDSDSTSGQWQAPNDSQTQNRPRSRVVGWLLVAVSLLLGGAAFYGVEQYITPYSQAAQPPQAWADAEYQRITRDIEAVQKIAQRFAGSSAERQAIFEMAENAWNQAQERHEIAATYPNVRTNTQLLQQARAALESYMATVLLPEDMVWTPAGVVDISGIQRYVDGFFIDRHEVTIGAYAEFCETVPGGWPGTQALLDYVEQYSDYPMVYVRFFDAQAYAAWKDAQLPTQQQWARAAYGQEAPSRYYTWGDAWRNDAAATQGSMEPVGSYPDDRSWVGCYDMVGNVSEWTRSPAGPETTHEDGQTPYFGTPMLIKGGNYNSPQIPLDQVQYVNFENLNMLLGFRTVRELATDAATVQQFIEHYRDMEAPAPASNGPDNAVDNDADNGVET